MSACELAEEGHVNGGSRPSPDARLDVEGSRGQSAMLLRRPSPPYLIIQQIFCHHAPTGEPFIRRGALAMQNSHMQPAPAGRVAPAAAAGGLGARDAFS